ncbi:hypothetical protein VIGAN_11025600 [Vigna angularis var. angularis]|uniref:Cytochrome P450 n=1 Tax=Vigna angularis var. angularis TaxID=157739 RepID=A0A0S3T7G4_PHAAN|nr:hypothetical protein VIGAN_11025600 [Vigna angularis var. angularis]
MRLFGVFTVGDAVPWLRWFDFGGHEKAMKETAKEMDSLVSEWLEEHRQNKALGGKVDGVQDFMDVMISMLDGQTSNGFDADTMTKSTVLVCVYVQTRLSILCCISFFINCSSYIFILHICFCSQ